MLSVVAAVVHSARGSVGAPEETRVELRIRDLARWRAGRHAHQVLRHPLADDFGVLGVAWRGHGSACEDLLVAGGARAVLSVRGRYREGIGALGLADRYSISALVRRACI